MPTQTRRKSLTFKILISIYVYILVVETYNMVVRLSAQKVETTLHVPQQGNGQTASQVTMAVTKVKTSHYGSDKMGPQWLKGVSQVSTCQHGAVTKRTRLTRRSVKHVTEKPCGSDVKHLHVEKNEPEARAQVQHAAEA